jgi:hypothetical protein
MSRFRLVLVAAVVLLLAWSLLGGRGTSWKTYDAQAGWAIERPGSATIQETGESVTFTNGSLVLTVRDAGPTKRADTKLPLDPVDFLPADGESGGTTARDMSVVAHHRAFDIRAVIGGSHDQAKAFRMLRSFRSTS